MEIKGKWTHERVCAQGSSVRKSVERVPQIEFSELWLWDFYLVCQRTTPGFLAVERVDDFEIFALICTNYIPRPGLELVYGMWFPKGECPLRYRLEGKRVNLRPLAIEDFEAWREIRIRCNDWLRKWEPRASVGGYQLYDRRLFGARCATAERERLSDSAYAFGLFLGDRLIGETNISSIQRGPCQTGNIGYWIDEDVAGNGFMPESVALVMRFAFETISLHRIQISIIPRNFSSRRVVEKLKLRLEGLSLKYLEINGVWEDHVHYAATQEEWSGLKSEYKLLYFR